MAPLPRLHPHHCLALSCRFCKANSPSRNWIINSNNRLVGHGLPPQHPYSRRGSNTPISSLALASHPPAPNRSRSLDGLLDAEPIHKAAASEAAKNSEQVPSLATKSCEDIDKDVIIRDEDETERSSNSKWNDVTHCVDTDSDKCSIYSTSSSDAKRKRNFMDRCVNKVRSLIKK